MLLETTHGINNPSKPTRTKKKKHIIKTHTLI